MTIPTNSQIDAAVHEALGLHKTCDGDTYIFDGPDGPWGRMRKCHRCRGLAETLKDTHTAFIPPSTTDPRLWWPLAWENNMLIVRAKGLAGYLDNAILHNLINHLNLEGKFQIVVVPGLDVDAGRAVCLAWLEMKGVKVNGKLRI